MRSSGLSPGLPLMLIVLALAGCSKDKPGVGPADASSAAPPTVTSAPASAWVAPSSTPSAYMTIPQRFASEANHRPTGVVRVEDAMAAFRRAGVELVEEKQHLASAYQAQYCVGAKTKADDVTLSLCEYRNTTEAKAGKAMNDKAFPSKTRKTYENGGTTLTVLEVVVNKENDEIVKKIVDGFVALKPGPGEAAPTPTPSTTASGNTALPAKPPPAPPAKP